MIWIELLGVVAVASSLLTVWYLSKRNAWRWGTVPGPAVEAGTGPYRGARTREALPRGVPKAVRWAAGAGIAWGVLTLFLFMPAGFLLLLVVGDAVADGVGWVVGATLLLLVSCDALILGFGYLSLAPALLRGGPEGARASRNVARWSTVHHLAVLGTFTCLAAAGHEGLMLLVLAFVPCLLGLTHAMLLERAADLCTLAEG